jgi:hypothetical protein
MQSQLLLTVCQSCFCFSDYLLLLILFFTILTNLISFWKALSGTGLKRILHLKDFISIPSVSIQTASADPSS